MAKRERRANRLPEGWFKTFIEAYDIKTTDDIKNALADIVGGTIETMLQAELETDLGYAKHDVKNKATDNSRNGSSSKTLRSDLGEIEVDIPRDRDGELEPKIVPKHQRDMPARYSRHFYDLYCMMQSSVKDSSLLNVDLLQKVVEFKKQFYPRGWAQYDNAKIEALKLVPTEYSRAVLQSDYDVMRGMIFGNAPSFDELMQQIANLEAEINSLNK